MFRKPIFVVMLVVTAVVLAACQPQTVEVTRVVTETQTEQVEVTRVVEGEVVTEEVAVEVTRVVEVAAPEMPEGELIVSLATEPNSLIPPNAAERNAINAGQQMFNGLTWVDDEGNIVPDLASGWELSDDGLNYTFTLRNDVVFHDGSTFECADFLHTVEISKDPINAYGYEYDVFTNLECADDYTLNLSTAEPDPLLLRKLSGMGVFPSDVTLAQMEEHPIGTGPFKFVEWIKGDRIVMEANLDYHEEGLPKLASLVFRPIIEESTRVAAIQTGEIHIANRLSAEQSQSLLGAPGVTIVRYAVDRVFYIAFNNLTSGLDQPTMDAKVRQAMNYAVDRQAIIDSLFGGYASLSTGFVTPGNLGYNEAVTPYPYDPEMAKSLLAEAGYPDGFTIGMACPTGAYTNFEQVCQAVGGYLAEVGIQPESGEIQFMESGQYWDLEATKQLPPLFGDSWSTTDGEALNRLRGALGGENASYSSWWTPEIQDSLDKISTTVDPDARAALYSEFQQALYDDPPFIYLYEPNTFEAINSTVQNYKPRSAENYYLKAVFLAASN